MITYLHHLLLIINYKFYSFDVNYVPIFSLSSLNSCPIYNKVFPLFLTHLSLSLLHKYALEREFETTPFWKITLFLGLQNIMAEASFFVGVIGNIQHSTHHQVIILSRFFLVGDQSWLMPQKGLLHIYINNGYSL